MPVPELKLACPKCGELATITFPDSFHFNRAVLECEFCNLRVDGTSDSNGLAIEDLQEKLKDWKDAEAAI
jgi:hypothetical protein